MTISQLKRSILVSYPGSSNIGEFHSALIEELIELRNAVAEEDWLKVRRLGVRCLGFGKGVSGVLQVERTTVQQRILASLASLKFLDETLLNLAQSDIRVEAVSAIRDQLQIDNPDLPARLEEVLQKVEQGTTGDSSLLRSIVEPKNLSRIPIELKVVKDATIAILSRGLLGIVHAEFNLSHQAHAPIVGQLIEANLQGALEDLNQEFSSELRARQIQVYSALASNSSTTEIIQAVEDLTAWIEQSLPGLARAQAVAHLAATGLREQGRGGASEELGHAAMRAGALTREAVASHAAAYQLAIELIGPDPEDQVKALTLKASTLAFDAKLPHGTDTELSKLNQVEDGKFIEIQGFMESHEVRRSADGKLISRIEIVDPSSGARACAATVFTHLAHTGVTQGSFCRINGTFRKQSSLCQGQPGVEIDRLSLAKLANQSWWVAFLRSANRWFENWRNENNMFWALGPYKIVDDGNEADENMSSFGAGELIFLPFIRE